MVTRDWKDKHFNVQKPLVTAEFVHSVLTPVTLHFATTFYSNFNICVSKSRAIISEYSIKQMVFTMEKHCVLFMYDVSCYSLRNLSTYLRILKFNIPYNLRRLGFRNLTASNNMFKLKAFVWQKRNKYFRKKWRYKLFPTIRRNMQA